MAVDKHELEYKDADGTRFVGHLAHPQGADKGGAAKLPGVLVFHAFWGCTDHEKEKADELAKNGYVALAVDLYGDGKVLKAREEAAGNMTPLVSDRPNKLLPRLKASFEALASLPYVDQEKIGCIGYCFGGLCALDSARQKIGVKAAVSFHGTLKSIPEAENTPIDAAIAIHHGDADSHIPMDQCLAIMEELRARGADWQFIHHAGAKHAFTEPKADSLGFPGIGYCAKADRRSWVHTIDFLNEKLKH